MSWTANLSECLREKSYEKRERGIDIEDTTGDGDKLLKQHVCWDESIWYARICVCLRAQAYCKYFVWNERMRLNASFNHSSWISNYSTCSVGNLQINFNRFLVFFLSHFSVFVVVSPKWKFHGRRPQINCSHSIIFSVFSFFSQPLLTHSSLTYYHLTDSWLSLYSFSSLLRTVSTAKWIKSNFT